MPITRTLVSLAAGATLSAMPALAAAPLPTTTFRTYTFDGCDHSLSERFGPGPRLCGSTWLTLLDIPGSQPDQRQTRISAAGPLRIDARTGYAVPGGRGPSRSIPSRATAIWPPTSASASCAVGSSSSPA